MNDPEIYRNFKSNESPQKKKPNVNANDCFSATVKWIYHATFMHRRVCGVSVLEIHIVQWHEICMFTNGRHFYLDVHCLKLRVNDTFNFEKKSHLLFELWKLDRIIKIFME